MVGLAEWVERRWVRLLQRIGAYRLASRAWYVYDSIVESVFPPQDLGHHRVEVLALAQTGVVLLAMSAKAKDRGGRAIREAISIAHGRRGIEMDMTRALLQQKGRLGLMAGEAKTGVPCFGTWAGEGRTGDSHAAACVTAVLEGGKRGLGTKEHVAGDGLRSAVWLSEQVVALVDGRLEIDSATARGAAAVSSRSIAVLRWTANPWWSFAPPVSVSLVASLGGVWGGADSSDGAAVCEWGDKCALLAC